MERLDFEFPGRAMATPARDFALAGVVGSGNLEVLLEREPLNGKCKVVVNTSAVGYRPVWRAVLEQFFKRHALEDVLVSINDAGATPAVVSLRLDQAAADIMQGDR